MPATLNRSMLAHEHFCQPTGDREEIRVEDYISYADDGDGRSVPAKLVTRCLECGAATYQPYTTTLREIR